MNRPEVWGALTLLSVAAAGCSIGEDAGTTSAPGLTADAQLVAEGWDLCADLVAGEDVDATPWTAGAAAPEEVQAVFRCLGPAPPGVPWDASLNPTDVELSAAQALPAEFLAFLDDPGPATPPGPDEACSSAGYTWHEYLLATAQGWFVSDLVIDPAIGTCAPLHLPPEEVNEALQWEILGTRSAPARP